MISAKSLRVWCAVSVMVLELIVLLTFDHWWLRKRGVVITCSSSTCPAARVYQSRRGDLLVSTDDYDWYVVFPEGRRIGLANRSNFFRLPGCVYSKTSPPLFALMSPVKSTTPDLLVEERHIEFNSLNNGRVQITWNR
jgi:hypothetical protein